MKVHLFGSTSSPSVASFALRRTAEDDETNTCEKVIHTVYKNFYVDDLCKSFSTAEEAVEVIKQLCTLLKSGGFHLTKFVSNSRSFLETVLENKPASSLVVSLGKALNGTPPPLCGRQVADKPRKRQLPSECGLPVQSIAIQFAFS